MKNHPLSTADYVSQLRSFECALESALESRDWEQMISVNQQLQHCFEQLSDSGLTEQPDIREALTRVQILCSALIQVCSRHRADTLAVIKKTRQNTVALSCYQQFRQSGQP